MECARSSTGSDHNNGKLSVVTLALLLSLFLCPYCLSLYAMCSQAHTYETLAHRRARAHMHTYTHTMALAHATSRRSMRVHNLYCCVTCDSVQVVMRDGSAGSSTRTIELWVQMEVHAHLILSVSSSLPFPLSPSIFSPCLLLV